MGKRVEGKKKKKGVKANVTSKFSSKRKLSRMGKKVKKGQMGPSTEFITRSTVLKRLQITLKDFRRLCILKGIYPRVPNNPPKGSDKVYYDIKDISYLQHEPLLQKFRQFKTFMKKIRKFSGRNQIDEARRKDDLKPDFNLNHLVKERYPRFIDALRDLDDALCMIHMIASLPSQGRVVAEKTLACQELALHWQYYVAKSKCLKKVFVSVKGIYFQAEIMSESITWLTPHQFTQAFPGDVDFRVIMTFLDFYEVYLRFVLFKLYNLQGLQYPPTIDQSLNEAGCCLLSVRSIPIDSSESTQPLLASLELDKKQNQAKTSTKKKNDIASLAKIASLEDKFDSILEHNIESNDSQINHQNDLISPLTTVFSDLHSNDYTEDDNLEENKAFVSTSTDEPSKLFANLKFFINREVPLQWLQLSCVSFGGQVGWSGPGSPFDESDDGITHHIIDRPIFGVPLKSRDYIQPQWVFDSINAKLLLPVHKYKPGVLLPPHLSPFVDDFKEGYLPKYREEILTLQSAVSANAGAQINIPSEVDNASSTSSSSEDEKVDKTNKKKEAKGRNKNKIETLTPDPPNNNSAKTKGPKAVIFEPAQQKISEQTEADNLAKIMMSKKTKRLYDRMQHGIDKKKEAISNLEKKRDLQSSSIEKPVKKAKK